MDAQIQKDFLAKWTEYFGSSRLPIGWFYTDSCEEDDLKNSVSEVRCMIGNLENVFNGQPLVYQKSTPGCLGGKRYSGFSQNLRTNFRYFLSCGIEGELEGERYKKNPEIVDEFLIRNPPFEAPGKYLVFKRWDKFLPHETPEVVIFIDSGDVLSALFTLANFDRINEGVAAPFGSGCSSIVDYPRREALKENPQCIFGMFDLSARPYIKSDSYSFSIPFIRFREMIAIMDESFLITESWRKIKIRLG
jgi:hypothetical protein